ncbi:GAF domain-containing protein [Thermodesulfobacteriota bacterium]
MACFISRDMPVFTRLIMKKGVSVAEVKSLAVYKKMRSIEKKIQCSKKRDDLLYSLVHDFVSVFRANWFSIYFFDTINRELISVFNSFDRQLRIPVSFKRFCCFSLLKEKMVNVRNAYDEKELFAVDPELPLFKLREKDGISGKKAAIVSPIYSRGRVVGVVEAISSKNNSGFSWEDEQLMSDLSRMLGTILVRQDNMFFIHNKIKNIAVNMLLTPKQLETAVNASRKNQNSIESVLMDDFKVSKKDIGESLSRFYGLPFIEINPHTLITGKLFVGLELSMMRENVFLPIRLVKNTILIAVDNPFDINKIEIIKGVYKGFPLKFVVALKEDILDYLNPSFNQKGKQNDDKANEELAIDNLIKSLDDLINLIDEEIDD